MTISQIHPEDLLDKDARGTITDAERARLVAHLADCPTCRFERQVRLDFAHELGDDLETRLGGADELDLDLEKTPEREHEAAPSPLPRATPSAHPSSRPAARTQRRFTLGLLAAAALFVGGVATASAGAGVWARISASIFSGQEQEVSSSDPKPIATALLTAKAPAAPVLAASAEVADDRGADVPSPEPAAQVLPVSVARTSAQAPSPSAPNVFAGFAVDDAATIFEQANEARSRGDYATALKLHRRLQSLHPKSRESHASYASVGRLLLDRGDAAAALQSFDAYQARGAGPLDEAVFVGRATALDRLGRADEARAAWSALLTAFPATPYAARARARIEDPR